MNHIRRLLDIVACTTSFGFASAGGKTAGRSNSKDPVGIKESASAETEPSQQQSPTADNGLETSPKPESGDQKPDSGNGAIQRGGGEKGEKSEKVDGDISMCPPPRLGQFYDFFSFSHLTPPIHCELFSLRNSLFSLILSLWNNVLPARPCLSVVMPAFLSGSCRAEHIHTYIHT